MGSMMHRVGGVVAAGAIAALAAGCSSGGSTSAPPASTASSASSASGAGASATSAAGSSTGSASTGSASGGSSSGGGSGGTGSTPSAVATQGGPPACTTQDLKVTIVNAQGAAGSVYENIDFTNTGSATCSLYGYPGVSLGTGLPFKQVGAAANRASGTSPTLVSLAPGKTANAQLRVVEALNYPSSKCSPTPVTYLQVYPPNQTAAIDVPYKSTGCASKSVNLLTIGVTQAGTGQ